MRVEISERLLSLSSHLIWLVLEVDTLAEDVSWSLDLRLLLQKALESPRIEFGPYVVIKWYLSSRFSTSSSTRNSCRCLYSRVRSIEVLVLDNLLPHRLLELLFVHSEIILKLLLVRETSTHIICCLLQQ